jgi:hypothetical protein
MIFILDKERLNILKSISLIDINFYKSIYFDDQNLTE